MKNPPNLKNSLLPECNIPNSRANKQVGIEQGNITLKKAKRQNRPVHRLTNVVEKKEKLYDAKSAPDYLGITSSVFGAHKRLGHVEFTILRGKAYFYESALDEFEKKYGPLYLID
jgi:hypothetical protein